MTSGNSTWRCRARARTRIQPEANTGNGSAKRRDQRSAMATGGAITIAPAKSCCHSSSVAGASGPRSTPMRFIQRVQLCQRAMHVNRPVVTRLAQQTDKPLRLAERIGADQMRALGKLRDRFQKLCDLARVIGMAEHRQAECRFGYEYVAWNGLEGWAGRIAAALVIAGYNDREPFQRITTCADPRMCPAGTSVTSTPLWEIVSPYCAACVAPAKSSP